jgi:capsular exopolysaccharide synthesis family protein
MSKVHEALRRAQEERSVGAQVDEKQNQVCTESVPPGSSSNPLKNLSSGGATLRTSSEAERIGSNGHSRSLGANQLETAFSAQTSAIGTEIAEGSAHLRPVQSQLPTATVGRDPKTGQFLRFEDLLRTCAQPAWVLDPMKVLFCESGRDGSAPSGTEQFRTLRTRLYHLRESSPLKKLLITSAVAGEGKTFVATNLAQAIARERDRRVLLIDADLRNPALHLPLGAPLSPGLSDFLSDRATDADIVQHGQEGKLCFVAAGTLNQNPTELLSNGGLERLLDGLSPLFDWVIIDSPPCLPVSDANLMARFCDGVLLVVRAKTTPSAALQKARKELQKRKVLGVVVNAVQACDADSYGSYYGYGEGGREKTKKSRY